MFSLWSVPRGYHEDNWDDPGRQAGRQTHLMKLQGLQNKVLRTIGNFLRRTPVRDLHIAFKIPYVYDYTV
jgi:hypothetical protein